MALSQISLVLKMWAITHKSIISNISQPPGLRSMYYLSRLNPLFHKNKV